MKISAATATMATDNNKDVTGCAGNGVANDMIFATTNQNYIISGWVRADRALCVQSTGLPFTTSGRSSP
eukprot:6775330-Heterocapsa_arctica.AAC.1